MARKKPRKLLHLTPTERAALDKAWATSVAALRLYKLRSEAKMAAFDQLPKTVRNALTASQFNWNVEQLLAQYQEKRMNARELVRYIANQDRGRLD